MIIIRPYRKEDEEFCRNLLNDEGVEEAHCYGVSPTWILEDGNPVGFFTFVQGDFVELRHFCVAQERRSMAVARLMIRGVREILRDVGIKQCLMKEVSIKYLQKMIEYYFKAKPVFKTERTRTYLVEV